VAALLNSMDEEPDDSDLENLSFDDDYLGEE
jgi:hypothetical protein